MTALLLQLICGWLWAGPLDGLQAGYEARTDQYHGHAVERIDYSRALAAHTHVQRLRTRTAQENLRELERRDVRQHQ
jgi:hypothetical protein